MEIRSAVKEDVPAVLPMVRKVCAFHEALDPAKYGFRPDPASMYSGWLTQRCDDPRSLFLVADAARAGEPARLVAFLIATAERELPVYRLREFGFIHDLWVEPEYRNEGVARQLVTLALERFERMGLRQVRLDTAEGNPGARDLFRTCGFRNSVTEMLVELKPRPGAEHQ